MMRVVLLLLASTFLSILTNIIAGYLQPAADRHRKFVVALFVFVLSFLILLNLPDVTGSHSFTYQVRVQAQTTQAAIVGARVALEIAGTPPLDALTDSNGVASIQVNDLYRGKSGRLRVEASGYTRFEQNITLSADELPKIILLSPLAAYKITEAWCDWL